MSIESNPDRAEKISYNEVELPERISIPRAVEQLVQERAFQDYWIYKSDEQTVAAVDPIGEVKVFDNRVEANWDGQLVAVETAVDPFEQVGRLLSGMPVNDWRAQGYVSFDTAGFYYPYPLPPSKPQMSFIIPRTEITSTFRKASLRTLEDPEQVVEDLLRKRKHKDRPYYKPNAPDLNLDDRYIYEGQVEKIVNDIRERQLAKVVLARTVYLPGHIDLFSTFNLLYPEDRVAERSYIFSQGEYSGVGLSPEIMMQTSANGMLKTTVLAGTRPVRQGEDYQQGQRVNQDLLSDPKELKEHLLSVWEIQENELKEVCAPDSICIKGLMNILELRTVKHLKSTVYGELGKNRTLWDGLRALFPAVTVTGIDKRTAIEKIVAYEHVPRGLYAGCVGWVDSAGNSEFTLALRSAFEDQDGVTIRAGAGIIAESLSSKEFAETYNKMRAIQERLVLK